MDPNQPIEPPEEEHLPQPQYGMPDPQSLELTRFMVDDDVFIYKDGQKDEDDAIIAGQIPPEMKNYFWGFLSKDVVLSMFDKKDVEIMMLKFRRAKLAYIMSISRKRFDYTTIRHLCNLEAKIHARYKRALNGFERKQQTTQTNTTLYGSVDQNDTGPQRSHGPLGLGRFFGGR